MIENLMLFGRTLRAGKTPMISTLARTVHGTRIPRVDVEHILEALGAVVRSSLPLRLKLSAIVVDPADPDAPETVEWIWILHDDSAPEPDALRALVERARVDRMLKNEEIQAL